MWRRALYAPHPVAFSLLFKKSLCNPYLGILDFSKLFAADAPMKKIYIFYPLSEHGHPVHILRNFENIFKNQDFGFYIFGKGQI